MSIAAIATVFRLDLPAQLKWLLVCLADSADPYGRNCFPSVGTLCEKSGMTERTVRRNLRVLEQRRLIARDTDEHSLSWLQKRGIPTTLYRLPFLAAREPLEPPKTDSTECPRALRREIILAFDLTCAYCHERGTDLNGPDGHLWTVDRIVPGSRGGSYAPENVTLACRRCNTRKGAKLAPAQIVSLAVVRGPMAARRGGQSHVVNGPLTVPTEYVSKTARKTSRPTRGLRSLGELINEAQKRASS